MTYDHDTLPILRNTVVRSIQQLIFHHIAERLQCGDNFIEIPFIGIEQPAHIFKKPNLRLKFFNRCNKNGESIP